MDENKEKILIDYFYFRKRYFYQLSTIFLLNNLYLWNCLTDQVEIFQEIHQYKDLVWKKIPDFELF